MELGLDDEVRAALQARRGDWPRIASDCEVSYSWLSKFVRHQIPNPSYRTLKRLRLRLIGAAPIADRAAEPITQPGALDAVGS